MIFNLNYQSFILKRARPNHSVSPSSISAQEASRMYNKKEDPVALRFKVIFCVILFSSKVHTCASSRMLGLVPWNGQWIYLNVYEQTSAIKWKTYAPTLVALGNKVCRLTCSLFSSFLLSPKTVNVLLEIFPFRFLKTSDDNRHILLGKLNVLRVGTATTTFRQDIWSTAG